MFLAVGSANSDYSLADLTIAGPASIANARNNYIMGFATGSAPKVDKARSYWYWQNKWRVRSGTNPNTDPQLTDEEAAAIKFNAGEGFMCNFAHATTKIQYAGEVITGGASKRMIVSRPSGYQNFVVSNVSASEISLADITIAGPASIANARNNYLMGFATGSAPKVDKARSYWYWQNKWRVRSGTNPNTDPQLTDEEAAAIKIPAGEGFMCNFAHATTTISLPTSL